MTATLWRGGRGYDLNALVAPSSFQITSADYITDQGEIFGHGFYTSGPNSGDQRVFALIRNPAVPLPSTSTAAAALPTAHADSPLAGAFQGFHRDHIAARTPALVLGPRAMRMNTAWPLHLRSSARPLRAEAVDILHRTAGRGADGGCRPRCAVASGQNVAPAASAAPPATTESAPMRLVQRGKSGDERGMRRSPALPTPSSWGPQRLMDRPS